MRVLRPLLVCTALLMMGAAGCASDVQPGERFTQTDSAGTLIAHSTSLTFATVELNEPILTIGVTSGPPHLMFDRIAGVTRLSDGNLAVGNGGSNSIRVFDNAGELVTEFGGEGEGPGEFTYIREVRRCQPDVITSFDYNWRRLLFTHAGEFLGSEYIRLPEGPGPYHLSCDSDGGILSTGWGDAAGADRPPGNYRTTVPLFSGPSVSGPFESLGTFPGNDRVRENSGDIPHPFGRTTVVAHHLSGFVLGTSDHYEFGIHRKGGEPYILVRWDGPPRSLTADLRSRHLAAELAEADEADHPGIRRALAEMVMPDSIPAYSDIKVDPADVAWVRAFTPPGVPSATWWGFVPSGEWRWELRMEPGFEAIEFGVDEVLGVSTDEFGIETVRVYQLDLPNDNVPEGE